MSKPYTFTEGGSMKTKPLCTMITAYSNLWNHTLMIILNALNKKYAVTHPYTIIIYY